MPAVSNTSVLQYLHFVELLSVLPALYGQVVVPASVSRELAVGRQQNPSLPDPTVFAWTRIVEPTRLLDVPPEWDLGAGEIEVVALAVEHSLSPVLLDDGLARRWGLSLGLPITGTVGVLVEAKRRGLCGPIRPVLEQLIEKRFRLHADVWSTALRLAGEL